MSKTKGISLTVLCIGIFMLLIYLMIFICQMITGQVFFISDDVNGFEKSDELIGLLGGALIAASFILFSFFGKKKWYICVAAVFILVIFLAGMILASFLADIVKPSDPFYHIFSPDGKTEVIIRKWVFFANEGADPYVRRGPCFVKRLNKKDPRVLLNFTEKTSVEWSDECVVINGISFGLE